MQGLLVTFLAIVLATTAVFKAAIYFDFSRWWTLAPAVLGVMFLWWRGRK